MKQLVLLLGMSLLNYSISYSIPKYIIASQTYTIDDKVTIMTSVLDLTTDQQKQYRALLISYEKDRKILNKIVKIVPEEKRKLEKAFIKNYQSKLTRILTTEQYAKIKEMLQKRDKELKRLRHS